MTRELCISTKERFHSDICIGGHGWRHDAYLCKDLQLKCTEADKGHQLSLLSCRFPVVASTLSLPSCRFHVVATIPGGA